MNRVNALRKLLAVGDLHRSEIDIAMGGDRLTTEDALAELTKSGEVKRVSSGYGVLMFRLTESARVRVFLEDSPSEKLESSVEPHAVRWAQRYVASKFETQYSEWHWTTNAKTTLCRRRIMAISDSPDILPEVQDEPERVDCKQCRRALVERCNTEVAA